MASLQEQVKDICRLADSVIENPSVSVKTTATNLGLGGAIVAFAAGGAIFPLAPIFLIGGPIGWGAAAATWVYKKIKDKEKAQQEKERMLREVIRKQQAVIRELDRQQASNKEEINNLKRMLEMLEETEKSIKAA